MVRETPHVNVLIDTSAVVLAKDNHASSDITNVLSPCLHGDHCVLI